MQGGSKSLQCAETLPSSLGTSTRLRWVEYSRHMLCCQMSPDFSFFRVKWTSNFIKWKLQKSESVMVWWWISVNGMGESHVCERTINAELYCIFVIFGERYVAIKTILYWKVSGYVSRTMSNVILHDLKQHGFMDRVRVLDWSDCNPILSPYWNCEVLYEGMHQTKNHHGLLSSWTLVFSKCGHSFLRKNYNNWYPFFLFLLFASAE